MIKLHDVFTFSNIEDNESMFKDAFYDESKYFFDE